MKRLLKLNTFVFYVYLKELNMQKQRLHNYPIGAHLIVKHFGYSHHGIYAGKGRVIHYSGFAHLFKKQPIEMGTECRFLPIKIAIGRPIATKSRPVAVSIRASDNRASVMV